MKKRLKKRFNSIVLCMTLLFTTIVSPVIAHAIEDTNIPKQAGKVFAGYYKDADCTQPVYEGEQVTTKYEKFVDENVLSVKCQITAGTKVTSSSTDLRLVTTVDSLNYKEVGFRIKAEGKTNEMTLSSKLVYTSISAFVKEDKTVYTPKAFSTESNFFMADKVLGILNDAFSVTFTATPYWITLDGTTVTGMPKTFTINDGVDKGSVYGDGIKITPAKRDQEAVFSVTEKKVAEGEDAGKTYTCIENIEKKGYSMLTIAATEAAGLVPNTECTVTVDVVLTYTGSSSSFPAYFDSSDNDFIIKSDNSGGPITFTITTDENGAFTKTWESVYINTCDMTVAFTDIQIVQDLGSVYGKGITVTPAKRNQQAVFDVTEKKVAEGEDAGKTYTCIENITTQGYSMLTIEATEDAGLRPNAEYTVTLDVVCDGSAPAYYEQHTGGNDFIISAPGGRIVFTVDTDENGEFRQFWDTIYILRTGMTVEFTGIHFVENIQSVYGKGITVTPSKRNQQAVFNVTEKILTDGEEAGKSYNCIEGITTQGFSMLTIAATEAAGLVPNTEYTVTVDVVLTYTGSSSSFPAYFDNATNDFIIKSDNSGGPITFTITTDENGAFTKTWESVYINTCDMTVSFTDLKIVPSN